jgi:hypothetical protein
VAMILATFQDIPTPDRVYRIKGEEIFIDPIADFIKNNKGKVKLIAESITKKTRIKIINPLELRISPIFPGDLVNNLISLCQAPGNFLKRPSLFRIAD